MPGGGVHVSQCQTVATFYSNHFSALFPLALCLSLRRSISTAKNVVGKFMSTAAAGSSAVCLARFPSKRSALVNFYTRHLLTLEKHCLESTKARVKSGNDRFSLISVNLSHPFSSKDEEEQWQLTKVVSLCNLGVLSKSPLIYSPNLRPTNSPAAFPVLWVFLVIRPSRWEGLNHFRVTWVSCY